MSRCAAHEDKILDTLKTAPKDGLSGPELAKATGLRSDPLYTAIALAALMLVAMVIAVTRFRRTLD